MHYTLHTYKDKLLWVFDDAQTGLVKEPFIAGIDWMLEVAHHKFCATPSFLLHVSDAPIEGGQLTLQYICEEFGWTGYFCIEQQETGWLCPNFSKYFAEAPATLYVQLENYTEAQEEHS